MKDVKVIINNEAYPCRPTMGALLRFEKETGKDISEVFVEGKPVGLTDICTLMWCCIVSASKHDGKDFNLSLMEFADSVTPEVALSWNSGVMGDQIADQGKGADGSGAAGGEKKSQ